MTVSKKTLVMCMLITCLDLAANVIAQGPDASLPRTMRPVIRGRQAAVSSMKAEATEAASRILQTGGNAFDAVVGGQAALAVTDFPSMVSAATPLCSFTTRGRKKCFPSTPNRALPSWPPSSGTRRTAAARFRSAMGCFPADFRAWWTRGTSCSTLGHDELRASAPARHRPGGKRISPQ